MYTECQEGMILFRGGCPQSRSNKMPSRLEVLLLLIIIRIIYLVLGSIILYTTTAVVDDVRRTHDEITAVPRIGTVPGVYLVLVHGKKRSQYLWKLVGWRSSCSKEGF